MKSAWRGEARGIAPKRMMSARGPPVWMSSIPQHASPNSRYQSEFSRAMLMSLSSWLVWKRVTSPPTPESIVFSAISVDPSRLENRRGLRGLPRLRLRLAAGRLVRRRAEVLHPLQIAVAPDPDQPDDQDRG